MEELELELETNIWDRPSTSYGTSSTRDFPEAMAGGSTRPTTSTTMAPAAGDDDDTTSIGSPSGATSMAGNTIDGAVAEELEAAFVAGLNNVSTSKNKVQVQELSNRTGVPASKIKQWIHNRTRKGKARFSGGSQRPTAYNGYMRVALKGLSGQERNKKMKESAEEWHKISKDEVLKARYLEMDRKHKEEMMDQMTDTQKRNSANRLMQKAQAIVNDFEKLGYACAFMASDGRQIRQGYSSTLNSVTRKGMEGLLLKDIFTRSEERVETEDRATLRKKVATLLNAKYRQGIPSSKRHTIPYNRLDSFQVDGLPEGVTLKRVSSYNKETLVKLVQHMPHIRFTAKPVQVGTGEPDIGGGQDELEQSAIPLADISDSDSDDTPIADMMSKKLPSAEKSFMRHEGKASNRKKEKKYYVSRILEKKGDSFKVLWKGYSLSKATWEPREHLPEEIVQNFEQQMDEGS